MYKSPVEISREQIKTQIDNEILFSVTQEVGINIDKDELCQKCVAEYFRKRADEKE